MKYIKIFLIILFIVMLDIQCSDWVGMPEIKQEKSFANELVPYNIYYMKNIFRIKSLYFFDDGGIISGTYDGYIFSSTNNGNNWSAGSKLDSSVSINCFVLYPFNIGLLGGRNILFAGTDCGIYRSTNNGFAWERVYSSKSEGMFGKKIVINCALLGFIFYFQTYYINLYGYDEDKNVFSTSDDGLKWFQNNALFLDSDYEGIDCDSYEGSIIKTIAFYNEKSKKSIVLYSNGSLNVKTYFDLKVNSVKINIMRGGRIIFIGTDRGIYRSMDSGNNWALSGLEDINVYSLVVINSNIIFAGTSRGIFSSSDNGENWKKQSFGGDYIIKKMYMNNDIVYMVTDMGEVLYFYAQEGADPILNGNGAYAPLLQKPVNKSTVPSNIALKWYDWNKIDNSIYQLQIATSETFSEPIFLDENISSKSYELKNLEIGKTYYWRVRSINLNGFTSWSEVFSFTVK